MELSNEQAKRYSRQILLPGFGIEGQQKISGSKVLVIGIGGLGSPVLLYLAAAGVGTLGVADPDIVDITNLNRQVIHFSEYLGAPKVDSAKKKINEINPDTTINSYKFQVNAENILDLIKDYDIVVDATDNFRSKFLINDACVIAGKPFSHAGVLKLEGQVMTVIPGQSACYRCVFNKPPPKDAVSTTIQAGILGSIAGILGTLQATEILKFIVGQGELLTNRLMIFDGNKMKFRNVDIKKRNNCPVCGNNPTITLVNSHIVEHDA